MLSVRLFHLFERTEDRRRETEGPTILGFSESYIALLAKKRISINKKSTHEPSFTNENERNISRK